MRVDVVGAGVAHYVPNLNVPIAAEITLEAHRNVSHIGLAVRGYFHFAAFA